MGNHRLMKKITFLIGSLGGGGAERVTVALADYFCESGYEVFSIVFSKVNNNYEINSKIKVDYLPEIQGKCNIFENKRIEKNIEKSSTRLCDFVRFRISIFDIRKFIK